MATDDFEDNCYTSKRIPVPRDQQPSFIVTAQWAEGNSYKLDRYVECRVMGYPRRIAAGLTLGLSDIIGIDWENANGECPLDRIALAVECNPVCRKRMNAAIERFDYVDNHWSRTQGTLALLDLLNSDKSSPEVKLKAVAALNNMTLSTPLPADMQRER